MELYKKYRPTLFKHIRGQEKAVAMLEAFLKNGKVPHTILFTGPSGCGKTTLARILVNKLGMVKDKDGTIKDLEEINAADFKGIDMVRDIRQRMGFSPLESPCRVWIIDECHQLTGDAQNAFLKILEDTPKHVYFMLATTVPNKLLKTIITRSTEISVKSLSNTELGSMIDDVLAKEKAKITEDVKDRLIEVAEGSARKALVILNQVLDVEGEASQLNAIQASDVRSAAIEIARLLHNKQTKWPEIAKRLQTVEEDPESVRRLVLGYASSILVKGGGPIMARAYSVIQEFRDHFYDCGKAGLIASCYAVIATGR